MPTYTRTDQRDVILLRNKSTGIERPSTQAPVRISYAYITKPDTSKRPKPVDLFRNSTARVVTSVVSEWGYGSTDSDRKSPTYGTITTAPLSYWMPNFPGPLRPDLSKLDGPIRAKIKDSNLNLAQAMAEYRQTARLFSNAVRDVAGIIRNIRSGRGGEKLFKALQQPPNKMSKAVANRWLEIQYGIRPLMSDVHGSAEALAKALDEGVFMYQSVKRVEKSFVPTSYAFLNGGTTHVVSQRVTARYRISSAAVKQLSEVGITNPALLAWEIIPYSFVIDWFVPVGNWLASIDALAGVSNLVVNRSYESVATTQVTGKSADFVMVPFGLSTEIRSERLAPSSSIGFPRLEYKPSLSLTKVLNAAALLRQLK